MNTNLTKEVEEIGSIHFEGNVIPMEWFNHIICDSGKPDAISIMILSDIVYWYRPTIIRSESTGKIMGYKKKFKADLLQRSYTDLESQFGFSRSQIKDALKRLEKHGLILRIFRNISNHGSTIANVMFLKPFPERIKQFTKTEEIGMSKFPQTYVDFSSDVCGKLLSHLDKFPQTYTENTTETTTNSILSQKVKKVSNLTKQSTVVKTVVNEREIEMLRIWNEVVEESNIEIKLTSKRLNLLAQRLKEFFNNDTSQWREFCKKIVSSKFLMGEITNFRVSLDWALKEDSLLKIIENNYGIGDRTIAQESNVVDNPELEEEINDPIWKNTREELKKQLGEGAFKSWISKLNFQAISDNIANFIAPTKFIKDWIITNYSNEIKQNFISCGASIQGIFIQVVESK